MMKSVLLSLGVVYLSGCTAFGDRIVEREVTKCVATRTLDANGKVVKLETCTGTSVRRGYPTFEGSGVDQKW